MFFMIIINLNSDKEGEKTPDGPTEAKDENAPNGAGADNKEEGAPKAGDDTKHNEFLGKMYKFPTVDSNKLLETNLAVISMQVERIRKALQTSHRNNTKLRGTINRVRHDQTVTKAEKEKVQKDYNRQKAILIVYDELVTQYIKNAIEEGKSQLEKKIDEFKTETDK